MHAMYLCVSDPFVTSYPVITTRGRVSEVFNMKEGFFIQYIIKFQPETAADYTFKIYETQTDKMLKLCKLVVTHIGDNMPCTTKPSSQVTLQERRNIGQRLKTVLDEEYLNKLQELSLNRYGKVAISIR
jgi:hypothetical protein